MDGYFFVFDLIIFFILRIGRDIYCKKPKYEFLIDNFGEFVIFKISYDI